MSREIAMVLVVLLASLLSMRYQDLDTSALVRQDLDQIQPRVMKDDFQPGFNCCRTKNMRGFIVPAAMTLITLEENDAAY